MDIAQFAEEVLGVRVSMDEASTQDNLPTALSTLYWLNSQLSEDILQTDLRFLDPGAMYEIGPYRIFAEEAQCVSYWGYVHPRDDADCFVITQTDPIEAFREERLLGDVVLAMVVANVLSTELLTHYRDGRFCGREFEALARQVSVAGQVLDAKAIVFGSVACLIEGADELYVRAASRSAEELVAFFSLVEATLGATLD